ncbi:hypothetical protein [Dyadobacter sediminis]|uniref:DUF3575 domain-containing protein n=1 Tax=Dyadobacter sediminis TaxID=1493691 RepID=A0A5R9KBA8_9BACT|nr:hypothetical protein [Dyadobacter sediminis]TLU92101.1 hypothetical protein FEM55_15235 [Dyadobacter sediminis]GGB97432.1 hypothetical protein GCM10011325_25950 [Dyadobacter sediminis]
MKSCLATLAILFSSPFSSAQDSIPVQFHQETDTLVKQRFIDRYENVFMTKVPTRHMFKAAAVGSEVQGAGINLGYEYKLMPAVSVEASVYAQLSRFNSSLANEFIHLDTKRVDIWGSAKLRWYYRMNKRIKKGLNANNFSGGYLALAYEQPLRRDNVFGTKRIGGFSLLYGFQSRFFNHGFIDFALGIY